MNGHQAPPRKTETANSANRLLILPLWLVAIYMVGTVMNTAAPIFLWVVCAFFLFVLLDPMTQALKRRGWPTALAALVLVLFATALTLGLLWVLGTLFSGMVAELQQSKKLFLQLFDSMNQTYHTWTAKFTSDQNAKSPLGEGGLGGTILHGLNSLFTILTYSLLIPILTFFFLAERDAFAAGFSRAFRSPRNAASIWPKIVHATQAFFVGNLVLAVVTYPIFALLFWLFSVPSVFSVAGLATFLNLIPFAGSVLSGFLPALALYAQTENWGTPLGLYGICVLIHFIVADFITPKVLGSQVNINATASTVALVAWGELWGAPGLILAIPMTSVIKILFENSNFFWLQWLAGLMSADADHTLKIAILKPTEPPRALKAEERS